MKDLYKEKLEYTKAKFNTRHGIMIWLVESLIFGYIIVNYTSVIYQYIYDKIPLTNLIIKNYLAYLGYGLFLLPLGLLTTFLLSIIFKSLFKDAKILK